jgi:hypothetical protein
MQRCAACFVSQIDFNSTLDEENLSLKYIISSRTGLYDGMMKKISSHNVNMIYVCSMIQ